jgi:hypothetical protein
MNHTLRILPILPLLVASTGCCGMCGDDSEADPGSSGAIATLPMTECKAVTDNIGAWRPSTKVLGRVARAIPNDTCMMPKQIAATLASCAAQANSVTVEASVEAPAFSACTHKSLVATWNNRHFVSIQVFVGEGANFHGQSYVYEIVDDEPVAAYTGFSGGSDLCSDGATAPNKDTSAKLRADWPNMSKTVRDFFCN